MTTSVSRRAHDAADPPIADFSFHPGISANTIAEGQLPEPGWAHRHTFYMITYIVQGSGTHVIDCVSYPLRPATLYFVRPEQVHLWEYHTLPSGFHIAFSEDFLCAERTDGGSGPHYSDLFNDLAAAAPVRLQAAQEGRVRPIFEELVREHHAGATNFAWVMQAYLHVLLASVHRELPAGAGDHVHARAARPLVRRFTDLVTHCRGPQSTVRDYSDALGVTPSHLAEMVKEVTGRTPGQIIRQTQVVEARRLLIHTEKNIAEIAYELGFKDTAYFGRFFRRETGTTPGHFRRHVPTWEPTVDLNDPPGVLPLARAG